jgi:hypothetical protein
MAITWRGYKNVKTSCPEQPPLEKAIANQLVKKFQAIRAVRRFIALFRKASQGPLF